tara:strand:+ start:1204 stop:1725 length:522 start_codon:yes stop_codon:yes gene_type:complete
MKTFECKEIKSEVFSDVKILEPEPFFDYRGDMWTFWEKENEVLPKGQEWKISKFSRSRKDVLRGLHGDEVTWKNISCVWGEIYLVIVDNRKDSETYLDWEGLVLSDKNHRSVLIPPGFLNGHLCLSQECLFHYTQSYPNEYVDWMNQTNMKWDDERLTIDWPIKNPILNWRDK